MTPSTEPLENAPFIKVSNHNNNDPHLAQHAGQRFAILGDFAQLLEVELKPGQSFRSEPGSMVYMKNIKSLKIETGGFGDACLRSCCAGEDFFRVNYVNKTSELAYVGIAPALPSKIIALDLSQYPEGIIYKNGAFLGTFDLNVNFNYKTTGSVAAGCFGGQGFVLNICKANTFTFFNACGTIIEKYLADGEILLVDTNAVVLMELSLKYSVKRSGGCGVCCCGGEGLFNTKLTGPGLVILESASWNRLVQQTSEQNSA